MNLSNSLTIILLPFSPLPPPHSYSINYSEVRSLESFIYIPHDLFILHTPTTFFFFISLLNTTPVLSFFITIYSIYPSYRSNRHFFVTFFQPYSHSLFLSRFIFH